MLIRALAVVTLALTGCDCGGTPTAPIDAGELADVPLIDSPFSPRDATWPLRPCDAPVRHLYVDVPSAPEGYPIETSQLGWRDELWTVTGGSRGVIGILRTDVSTGVTDSFDGPTYPLRAFPFAIRVTDDGIETMVNLEAAPFGDPLLVRVDRTGAFTTAPAERPPGHYGVAEVATANALLGIGGPEGGGGPLLLLRWVDGVLDASPIPDLLVPVTGFGWEATPTSDTVYLWHPVGTTEVHVAVVDASGPAPLDIVWTPVALDTGPDDEVQVTDLSVTGDGLVMTSLLRESIDPTVPSFEPQLLALSWLDDTLAVTSEWTTEAGDDDWQAGAAVFGERDTLGVVLSVRPRARAPWGRLVSYGRSPVAGRVDDLRLVTDVVGEADVATPFGWETSTGAHAVAVRGYDTEIYVFCEER